MGQWPEGEAGAGRAVEGRYRVTAFRKPGREVGAGVVVLLRVFGRLRREKPG